MLGLGAETQGQSGGGFCGRRGALHWAVAALGLVQSPLLLIWWGW